MMTCETILLHYLVKFEYRQEHRYHYKPYNQAHGQNERGFKEADRPLEFSVKVRLVGPGGLFEHLGEPSGLLSGRDDLQEGGGEAFEAG